MVQRTILRHRRVRKLGDKVGGPSDSREGLPAPVWRAGRHGPQEPTIRSAPSGDSAIKRIALAGQLGGPPVVAAEIYSHHRQKHREATEWDHFKHHGDMRTEIEEIAVRSPQALLLHTPLTCTDRSTA